MNDENLNPLGGGDDSPLHWIKRPRTLSPTSPSLPLSNLAAVNPRQNSPQQTQKQKVLIQTISKQLIKYRTLRALNTMKELSDFSQAFSQFVRDECKREADLLLSDKDPPLKDFDINSYYMVKDQWSGFHPSALTRPRKAHARSIHSSTEEKQCGFLRRSPIQVLTWLIVS